MNLIDRYNLSYDNTKYALVLVDDYNELTFIYTLTTKSSSLVLNQIKNWFAYAETQFQLPIKSIKCDNGTEFKNSEIEKFFNNMVVVVNYTVPGHSEENGAAERKIQTLKNKANCLLDQIEGKNLK